MSGELERRQVELQRLLRCRRRAHQVSLTRFAKIKIHKNVLEINRIRTTSRPMRFINLVTLLF
jgi:hypothetical protein